MKLRITVIALLAVIMSSCKKSSSTTTTINYPTDQLISYFNFDNNLKDQKGNTPDGTNNGGATFVTGVGGQAISLNGVDQSISFTRKSFKTGNNISVSLWFKTVDTASGLKLFVTCSDFSVSTNGHSAGYSISIPSTSTAFGNYTPGTWTHYVGTYDGTNIKVYINGVLATTVNWLGDVADLDRALTLGYFNSDYWKGEIDDLFIYGKTLTQSEVAQLYDMH